MHNIVNVINATGLGTSKWLKGQVFLPKFSKFKCEKRKAREKTSQWDILQNEHLINSISLGCTLHEPEKVGLVFLLLSKRINLHFPLECRARILAHALLFIAARPRGAGQGNHTGARVGLTLNGICGF